ncbi:MAG TPA: hypothetical protein VMD02_06960 [Candidatus Omnitrophota bacterium]|nr:hypothetical protein [Candidatus Omnitrophota bacterium]
MKGSGWIKALFMFVGAVEFAVGGLFIFFPMQVYAWSGMARSVPPEYIQFPALLIMVFGLMMFNIASDPAKNRNLIFYCILFKAALCSVVVYNWAFGEISSLWKIFLGFDLAYLIGFILALRAIPHPPSR